MSGLLANGRPDLVIGVIMARESIKKLHRKEEKLHHKAERAMKADEKVHEKIEKMGKKDKPKPKDPKPKGVKYSKKAEEFIGKRMREAAKGEMHSGSKKGPVVKDKKQMLAIALSEAREKGMKVPKRKK